MFSPRHLHTLKKTINYPLLACFFACSTSIFVTSFAATASTPYQLQVNYLNEAQEGLYEVQFNNQHQVVMTAVIDRLQADKDIGYVYGFDSESLARKWRIDMPHQSFSLAQDKKNGILFVGHGKNKSLNISRVNIATGQLEKTGSRLQVESSFEGNEGLRHMVFVPTQNILFVGYSSTNSATSEKVSSQRLLIVDPENLALIGEVPNAYPTTGYALSYDEKTDRIYTAGSFINEIDPSTRKVIRSIPLDTLNPPPQNILALSIDSQGGRIFAANNVFRSTGENDGVYVLDLQTGKQIDFIRSGQGSISVAFNPTLNEAYVANFRAGNISVINGADYSVSRQFSIGPLPNEMIMDTEKNRLYVGLKEVYSTRSSTGDFVEGAKERILKIQLPLTKN